MEQLPIGLFSDKINFDRYVHYEEVYAHCENLLKQSWVPEIGMPVTYDNGGKGVIIAIHPNGDIETKDVATDDEMMTIFQRYQMMQQAKLAKYQALRSVMNVESVKEMLSEGEAK